MKKNIGLLLLLLLAVVSCTEDINVNGRLDDGRIRFTVTMADSIDGISITRAVTAQDTMSPILLCCDDEQPLYLHRTVEPFPTTGTTRSTMINNVGTDLKALGCFGVSGYRYNPATQAETDVNANFIFNAKVTEYGDKWSTSESYYIPANNERLAFYAYAPYTTSGGTYDVNRISGEAAGEHAPMILEYTVNPDVTKQTDLITATAHNQTFGPGDEVELPFTHALTAVRFVLEDDVAPGWTLTDLSIEKVINHARYKVGTGWLTNEGDATTGTFTISPAKSTDDTNRNVTSDTQTFLMIPQHFNNNDKLQRLAITLTKGSSTKILYHPLEGERWTAGTMITYAITTSSINIVQAAISYPADWGGEAFTLKDSYDDATAVGVYAVDISAQPHKVVTANMKLIYNKTAGTWNTEGDNVLKYNRNYDYYFYYPYAASISGGHALDDTFSGSSASDFFSGVISNWTVTDDQSTDDKLLPNDLHIGQAVHDAKNFTKASVAMQHALGLAKITLETKTITASSVTYKPASTSSGSEFTRENQPIYIRATDQLTSPSFSSYLYLHNNETYYYITKGNKSILFKGITGVHNEWKSSITATTSNGTCSAYTATPKDPPSNARYEGVFFTCISDVQSYDVEEKGLYQLEVYGAKGASNWGGNGGYATGQALLSAGKVYVCVGAQGQDFYDTNGGNTRLGGAGGYNGGGNGGNTAATNSKESGAHGGGGGGGATHIATTDYGELKYYTEHRDDVLIVAGGGGGCCKHNASNVWYPGGVGGGAAGGNSSKPSSNNDSKCPISYGAGVDASHPGYAFGQGQNGRYGTINGWGSWGGGGGGGGWMGGYSSQSSGYITDAAGGGGCGYIQESQFLAGSYSMSSGVRTGDGYAIITSPIPVN